MYVNEAYKNKKKNEQDQSFSQQRVLVVQDLKQI